MDREEESVCCQEIPAFVAIKQESAKIEGITIPECMTDNPVFQNLFKLLGIKTFLESLLAAIWCQGI